MTFFTKTNKIEKMIELFKEQGAKVDFDRRAGTLVVTDDNVVVYRGIQKAKRDWIVTVRDNYRFKWSDDAIVKSRNVLNFANSSSEETSLANQ